MSGVLILNLNIMEKLTVDELNILIQLIIGEQKRITPFVIEPNYSNKHYNEKLKILNKLKEILIKELL